MAPSDSSSFVRQLASWLLGLTGLAALVVLFNYYGYSVLPGRERQIPPGEMRPLEEGKPAYIYPYAESEADRPLNWRSRVRLRENADPLPAHRMNVAYVLQGGGAWVHQPGRIVFSTSDNSDPRRNGRKYFIWSPRWYQQTCGRRASAAFIASVLGLWWLRRARRGAAGSTIAPIAGARPGLWHLAGAAAVFLAGLYCNTGTLTPYAITTAPYVAPSGYLYSPDHPHFRAVYDFISGAPRAKWDHALLLRRILYPVLARPFTAIWGFEAGGTVASLLLNTAGLIAFLLWMRRRLGPRAAVWAGWILAVSPGAAYWGGLPYSYAWIFPGCLALFALLHELGEAPSLGRAALLSGAMGLAYLGYDLGLFFIPASVLVLLGRRHLGRLLLCLPLQALPSLLWMLILQVGFHQDWSNANTNIYGSISGSWIGGLGQMHWSAAASSTLDIAGYAFFGANFIFLPALFLVAVLLNPLTSSIRWLPAELGLIAAAGGMLAINCLSPTYPGWDMHGSWISRLYQPVFPALVVFIARWAQSLPLRPKAAAAALVAAAAAANALIVFGPITSDPLGVSQFAFYRFYDHNEVHEIYAVMRHAHPARPLGFPPRSR